MRASWMVENEVGASRYGQSKFPIKAASDPALRNSRLPSLTLALSVQVLIQNFDILSQFFCINFDPKTDCIKILLILGCLGGSVG